MKIRYRHWNVICIYIFACIYWNGGYYANGINVVVCQSNNLTKHLFPPNGPLLYKLQCNKNKSEEPHTHMIWLSKNLLDYSKILPAQSMHDSHAVNNYLFSWFWICPPQMSICIHQLHMPYTATCIRSLTKHDVMGCGTCRDFGDLNISLVCSLGDSEWA